MIMYRIVMQTMDQDQLVMRTEMVLGSVTSIRSLCRLLFLHDTDAKEISAYAGEDLLLYYVRDH